MSKVSAAQQTIADQKEQIKKLREKLEQDQLQAQIDELQQLIQQQQKDKEAAAQREKEAAERQAAFDAWSTQQVSSLQATFSAIQNQFQTSMQGFAGMDQLLSGFVGGGFAPAQSSAPMGAAPAGLFGGPIAVSPGFYPGMRGMRR